MKTVLRLFTFTLSLLIAIVVMTILGLTVHGVTGNPNPETIFKDLRSEGQPFELSADRGRYALIMSVVENNSLQFTREIAMLALPDLGTINKHYVSLFAPGVSYVAIPLYVLGKNYNLAQLATYSTTAILAFLNFILIVLVTKRITNNLLAGYVGGLAFIFGTTAWAYSGLLHEHHYSVFLILLATLLILGKTNVNKNLLVGILFGLGIFIEYPNGILFLPLILWLITKHFEVSLVHDKLRTSVSFSGIVILFGFIIGVVPSLMYNQGAYGNPFQLAGTVSSVRSIEGLDELPTAPSNKSAVGFFKLVKMPQGLDVLIASKDRGVIIFSPVILLGLLGLWKMAKDKHEAAYALTGVVLATLIFFSMWGDPWGGWGFGPRYLIPAFAILGVGIGYAIDKFGRRIMFTILFFALFVYSVAVNLAGALTSVQIPPSSEPVSKTFPQPTYLHNFDLIKTNSSGSYIYNTYLKNVISLYDVGVYVLIAVSIMGIVAYVVAVHSSKKGDI